MASSTSKKGAPAAAMSPGLPPRPRRPRQVLRYSAMFPGLLVLGAFALYPAVYSLVISLFNCPIAFPLAAVIRQQSGKPEKKPSCPEEPHKGGSIAILAKRRLSWCALQPSKPE